MLRNVTGWDVSAGELHETARRIVSAKRQFNLLAGWTPAEDSLPERFLNTPLPNDPAALLSRERLNDLEWVQLQRAQMPERKCPIV